MHILLPKITDFIKREDNDLSKLINSAMELTDDTVLMNIFKSRRYTNLVDEFLKSHTDDNFHFWWHYLDMVKILLMFIRAQREGLWSLHLDTFKLMLPYFHRYDHLNYAKWGMVYLAEMSKLPKVIQNEFQQGN